MLETLDFTICIGSTPTFSYFDLYLHEHCLRNTLRSILITVIVELAPADAWVFLDKCSSVATVSSHVFCVTVFVGDYPRCFPRYL